MNTRFDKIKTNLKQKSNDQKEKTRRDYKEFFEHPLLFVALIASGFLSALAGVTIGLGVKMVEGNVRINGDVPHIFFSILYFILFPYFFEFGLANWLHKFLHREQDNIIQFWTSAVMICVTFLGTAITAYSAMDILVTAGGFFDSFTEIPAGVQRWIAFALPTMFLLNIVSGELYRQFTQSAILSRAAEMELREAQVASDLEVELAQKDARKNIAIHAANEYSRVAEQHTEGLGKAKGQERWRNDAANYQSAHPVQQNAAMTTPIPEIVERTSDNGHKPDPKD